METPKIVSRIETLLAEKGTPKQEFYEAVGISSASMSQWRAGKIIPRYQTLERIAEYFGISYESLITGEKEKPVPSDGLDSPVAWATAWDQASPELRRAALAVLKSGEPSAESQG